MITQHRWLSRMMVAMCFLITVTTIQAKETDKQIKKTEITLDGINYAAYIKAHIVTADGDTIIDGVQYHRRDTISVDTVYYAEVAKYTIDKTTHDSLFYKGDVVIPEIIIADDEPYPVTTTATKAFSGCRELTSVTLPASCVNIGRLTFEDCVLLKSSPIPMTATSVGTGVFKGCTNLEEVTIVPGWEKTVSEEFAYCPNLKRLIIAEGETPVEMKINMFGSNSEARTAINSIEYINMGATWMPASTRTTSSPSTTWPT